MNKIMLKIGEFNKLRIIKEVKFGIFLDGFDYGEILLPKQYIPKEFKINDEIKVFIYNDSEDRIIATTLKPKAKVGDFALLKMISKNDFGVFFDWGLPKDLFVPLREQRNDMEVGRSYILYIYLDTITERIAGSAKPENYLNKNTSDLKKGQEVDLMIYKKTKLGYKAIINGTFEGILYENEIFQSLKIGQIITGHIKKIREDGKIDLSISKSGQGMIEELSEQIQNKLIEAGGFLNLNDKSSPEDISEMFGVSKKAFKKAIGFLYKRKTIIFADDGIRKIDN